MTRVQHWTDHIEEYKGNPFIEALPGPQSFKSDLKLLQYDPVFDPHSRTFDTCTRKILLNRIRNYMTPIQIQVAVPERIRMALYNGYLHRNPLRPEYKKLILQSRDCLDKVRSGGNYDSLPTPRTGGVPGFTMLGCPGMGKSLTIDRSMGPYPEKIVHLLPTIITQIPILKIECPSSGSRKSLCIDILSKIATIVGVDLLKLAGRAPNVDVLMMYVQHQALICGLGMLIIDEIQHINNAKEGSDVVMNFLVTLANRLMLPIVLVGTNTAEIVLQRDFRIGRRSSGGGSPRWNNLKQGPEFGSFVEGMWKYQWCREETPLSSDLLNVMYDESQGVLDIAVTLFYLAQLHLMRLSERRPEVRELISPKLLRRVAASDLYLVAPMINALRSGDLHALSKFTDLKPLHSYVSDVVAKVNTESGLPSPDPEILMHAHLASRDIGDEVPHESAALRSLMTGFGVSAEEQIQLLAEIDALSPAGDLRTRSEVMGRLLNRRKAGRRGPVRAALTPHYVQGDLRKIVASGKLEQRSGYDELRSKEVVKDCLAVLS